MSIDPTSQKALQARFYNALKEGKSIDVEKTAAAQEAFEKMGVGGLVLDWLSGTRLGNLFGFQSLSQRVQKASQAATGDFANATAKFEAVQKSCRR